MGQRTYETILGTPQETEIELCYRKGDRLMDNFGHITTEFEVPRIMA